MFLLARYHTISVLQGVFAGVVRDCLCEKSRRDCRSQDKDKTILSLIQAYYYAKPYACEDL
jgi:hypothetical protein